MNSMNESFTQTHGLKHWFIQELITYVWVIESFNQLICLKYKFL